MNSSVSNTQYRDRPLYELALPQRAQAAFVGVRNTFYRLSMIAGQGGLVVLAGWLQERSGQPQVAWSFVFWLLVGLFAAAGLRIDPEFGRRD